MSRNNLVSPFIEKKHTVRLYKQGKCWVTIGITMATLAGISLATGTTAKAADNAAGDAAPETSQSTANTPSNTATLRTPAKPAANATNNATESASANATNTPTANSTNNKQNAAATANPKVAPTPAPAPAPVQTPQATETNTIVKTTDAKGNASTDPTKTETNTPVEVSGQEVAKGFTTGGTANPDVENGSTNPTQPKFEKNNGNTVKLTDPSDKNYVQVGVAAAKDAVDFKTDFSLSATVNVKWDPSMNDWLGGDGMAVSLQPISNQDTLTKAVQGSAMGLAAQDSAGNPVVGTIAYVISTNPLGLSPQSVNTANGTKVAYHGDGNWVIYPSSSDTMVAKDSVYDTGIGVPQDKTTGQLNYTFDVAYTTNNNQLVTTVLDTNNHPVKTYVQQIDNSEIGKNYVLSVSGATASSKAAYTATINGYKYVPADAKLDITNNINTPSAEQSGILGTPGQVIAFYRAGTQAPTTDANGKAVSVAYAVPTVPDYTLAGSQFITLAAGGVNNIELNYAKAQTVTATVTIPSNLGNQIVTNVTGVVNTIVNVPVPTISGYTQDKTTVPSTVNDNGTITVNGPKAKTGDAGYVTYTKTKTTDDNNQPGGSTTETTQTDTTTPPTTTDSNTDTTTPTTTDSDNDTTTPTTTTDSTTPAVTTDSSNDTAAPTATKNSKDGQVTPSISTDSSKGTVVPEAQSATQSGSQSTTEQHATTVSPSATGQTKVTELSNSITAPSQSPTGQKETTQNASGQLPQTNEQSDQTKATGFLGLIMLSLLSFFGLRRKQTGDK
ncbi:hypothetical protein ACFP1H_03075 [Secundilactobacillus hailunensis]|uniref:Gram-positive cocci surface proteins LPxTG domain-containing protein n=1 Tax=Secundilactobacillus hailunensis TaxID=2559923 RepID=A0ABW1T7B6_9LACO|nr:hypothetical protein [Secundilactobacillus hailunensis]